MQTDPTDTTNHNNVTLVWFKRDLRVVDHAALQHAVALGGQVLPLYIVEPDYWQLPDISARHWNFVVGCLADLQNDLAQLGARLVIRTGDAVFELEKLRQNFEITQMVSHTETGNLWTFARDRRVLAWARNMKVAWTELPQSAVVRGRARGNQWAQRRMRYVRDCVIPAPQRLRGVVVHPGRLPSAMQLGLRNDLPAVAQEGGSPTG